MRALLLDSHSLLFRAFHALPEMNTSTGQATQALYGFSVLLLKLLRESEWLVRLRDDLPLPEDEPRPLDAAARERTAALFAAWEFKSLIPRLHALP